MTVTGTTGGKGTKAIANRYPVEEGLTAGTTKQTGNKESLEAEEASLIRYNEKIGIY